MNEKKSNKEQTIDDTIVRDIKTAVAGLDYGIITIKVHNSKIVQIEITKKIRYDSGQFEKGGGI
jgi:hypothetical protein